MSRSLTARWQSGYAADCKSVYVGSIPARASISQIPLDFSARPATKARYSAFESGLKNVHQVAGGRRPRHAKSLPRPK